MKPNIVLIGPSQTGKTTEAKLLGERLNRPVHELVELRWTYYPPFSEKFVNNSRNT
ncbi:MAG: hypothetical protein K8I30_00930 [Anaerolineae bacterium]|nr:hypothetical protein [Anaerolineae bacterium]